MMTERDILEAFNERAAIFEFDCGMSRPMAEIKAIDHIRTTYGAGWVKTIRKHLEGKNEDQRTN